MRLLFTGSFSIWLIFAAFAIVATLLIYRRHNLPSPWSFWLPFLRICALLLLGLTFLQPVLSRVWTVKERGKIAVLIDDSASMGIPDDYSDSEAVDIAWRFGLFPEKLRNRDFAKLAERIDKTLGQLTAAEKRLKDEQDASALKEVLADLNDDLNDYQRIAQQTADTTDYLKAIEGTDAKLVAHSLHKFGKVLFEKYNNVRGNLLAHLNKAKKFPNSPDEISYLDSFSIPRNRGDHYGGRLSAYIKPPMSGDYIFLIASDDQSRLMLRGEDGKMQRIAFVPNYSGPEELTKFPQQQSKKVKLQKGKKYYLEAVYKEGWGDDHLSVGWIRPDGKKEFPLSAAYSVKNVAKPAPHIVFQSESQLFQKTLAQIAKIVTGLIKQDNAKELFTCRKLLQKLALSAHQLQQYADSCLARSKQADVLKACEKVRSVKRFEWVKTVINQKPLELHQKLKEAGEVELYTLDSEKEPSPIKSLDEAKAELPVTRLGSTMTKILGLYKNKPLAAMVVLTDGNNNSGTSFPEVKKMFADQEVPVFAVGFGKKTALKDICIEKIYAPTSSFKDDKLTLRVAVKRPGFENDAIKVKVISENKVMAEKVIPPSDAAQEDVALSFTESREGLHHYTVTVNEEPGEALTINNSKNVTVNILRDPINALLIDEYPRWESRYLNMMLKRDKRIKLDTVFVASSRVNKKMPGIPDTRDKLFRYDVLVLGDINPKHLTLEQQEAIRDFVVKKGGCCIIMAGTEFMPNAYRETPVAQIMPIKIKPGSIMQQESSLNKGSEKMRLTELAKHENITQLGETPANSMELWDKLSGINWLKEGIMVKPNAELLVETADSEQPVMLSAFIGSGKVLFMAADSFWKWRKRLRWKYHHRFWSQVMLWATTGRTTGAGKYVKLMTERPVYSPGETITLRARVLKDEDTPLENGTLTADILDGKGKLVKHIFFNYINDSGGEYRTRIKELPVGKYTIRPQVKELEGKEITASYSFDVRIKPGAEYVNLHLDRQELVYLSHGYRFFTGADELLKMIPKVTVDEEKRLDYELWDTFYFMILVALLLTVEWALRKRLKLL